MELNNYYSQATACIKI